MSTLKVTNIQDTSGGNSLTTQQLYNGSAKAWVNFDGTGTYSPNPSVTKIRASYNVSSVFKNGTGRYTINFTNAMPDANYTVNYSAGISNNVGTVIEYGNPVPTINSVLVVSYGYTNGANADRQFNSIIIFR